MSILVHIKVLKPIDLYFVNKNVFFNQNFPVNDLIKCDENSNTEYWFIHTMKEADQIKRKGQMMENLECEEFKQLWNSFLHGTILYI